MRKTLICAASITALTLTACSKPALDNGAASEEAVTVAEDAASVGAAGESNTLPSLDNVPVSMPQLAYEFDYRWRMEPDAIGTLQRRHASQCEQQGPAICQIIGMTKTGADKGNVEGELRMAVATRQARAFGALLEDEALESGAEQVSADIASEELSKEIVDTEARLRARTELRDRLEEVLRTRKGKVSELVEAERGVAEVNEEIDQARSWLKQMEGRVAYSRVTVHYETGTAASRSFFGPVMSALGSLGAIFGWIAALMILVSAVALPLAGLRWANRAIRRRFLAEAPAPTAPKPS